MPENRIQSLLIAVLACLTLGLAPFFPEPHLWGKLKWVIGGAKDMMLMDYFDLLLHGIPWLYLIYILLGFVVSNRKKTQNPAQGS